MINGTPAYCINLYGRKDRYDECRKEFNKFGLDVQVVRFNKDDTLGGNLGIYTICSLFLKNTAGYEYFWLFADDIVFEDNMLEVYKKSWDELMACNWSIFYLGATIIDKTYKVSDNLLKVGGAYAMHSMCISKACAKQIVDRKDEYMYIEPSDVWINREIIKKSDCYMCYPMVGYQRPSYSTIEQKMVDYKQMMINQLNKFMA